MSPAPPREPLDALPLPPEAVLVHLPAEELALPTGSLERQQRWLAVRALQQELKQRRLTLPLGPSLEPEDPARLLQLNHFALQLVVGGATAEALSVDLGFWQQAATAPQLVLAAAVDLDADVVIFDGVLTPQDFVAAVQQAERSPEGRVMLEREHFQGGLERLLTLVQLLDKAALPRLSLAPNRGIRPIAVADWLAGVLDQALEQLGGNLQPMPAQDAFRGGGTYGVISNIIPAKSRASPEKQTESLATALLVIPLGLAVQSGELLWGEATQDCVERFQLLLIPIGGPRPEGLRLRLVPELEGDLLPDDLILEATQGAHSQSIRSADSLSLELEFHGTTELIDVTVQHPGSPSLVLPPLQLGV